MKHDLIYYFPWYQFTREQMPAMIRECQDWGIRRFVFTNDLVQKCMEDPSWIDFLHSLERSFGVQFLSMHAPFEIASKLDVYMAYKAFHSFYNN